MNIRTRLIAASFACLFGAAAPLSAANDWHWQTLDDPGSINTRATGINDADQVIGSSLHQVGDTYHERGFLYDLDHNTYTSIDKPGSLFTNPWGINDAGQIVGDWADNTGRFGFLYSAGMFLPLNVPGSGSTTPFAINNSGVVVGHYLNPEGTEQHGFRLSGGSFDTIDVPGALYTSAFGINDAGDIVGAYTDATGNHGFIDRGGLFTRFDITVPGTYFTSLTDINDLGAIAGVYGIVTGTGARSFVDDAGMIEYLDLLGRVEISVWGINDGGHIAGNYFERSRDFGFIGIPGLGPGIDEPKTLALVIAALALLARSRPRRAATS